MADGFAQDPLGLGRGQVGGADPGGSQALCFTRNSIPLAAEAVPLSVAHQAQLAPFFCEACIGVVFAQLQPEFGATGEHAVWLDHALADQVVNQHAQVGLVATRRPRRLAAHLQRGVQASVQTLGGRFFVAGRAIDLAGEKQPVNLLGFKAALELARVEIVVLDGVARAQDVRVFQTLHGAHQVVLDVKRQAGGDAVRVVLVGGQSLGFQKYLVAGFVGKAVDLVFNAWAIARPHPFNLSGEHGAAVEA